MTASAFQLQRQGDDTLALVGELTFETAHAALRALRERLQSDPVRALDLGGVQRGDSAGLSCLLVLLAESRTRGHELAVHAMPEGMRALARVCEVESLLARRGASDAG